MNSHSLQAKEFSMIETIFYIFIALLIIGFIGSIIDSNPQPAMTQREATPPKNPVATPIINESRVNEQSVATPIIKEYKVKEHRINFIPKRNSVNVMDVSIGNETGKIQVYRSRTSRHLLSCTVSLLEYRFDTQINILKSSCPSRTVTYLGRKSSGIVLTQTFTSKRGSPVNIYDEKISLQFWIWNYQNGIRQKAYSTLDYTNRFTVTYAKGSKSVIETIESISL